MVTVNLVGALMLFDGLGEVATRQFLDLSGELDAGRACTDDNEAEQGCGELSASLVDVSLFEATQDLLTQDLGILDGL